MAPLRLAAVALLFGSASAAANNANPIRRVVTLLQSMQKKVTAEGARDAELFEKFMCYCTTGATDLAASIKNAEEKMGFVTSALTAAQATQDQLKGDLKKHMADRVDAKDALAKATALREKEAAAFAKAQSDLKTNIAALGKAIKAISDGSGAAFLQSTAASTVRDLAINLNMNSGDRDLITAFLSGSDAYAPQSGEIIGILKQMHDTMKSDLAELEATEKEAKSNFAGLSAAKEKEIATNTKSIEEKTARSGRVAVEIVEYKEDLEGTSDTYAEDKKFVADLEKNCATKKVEYDAVKKTRAEELVALADVIKILNDDDALDLFKKTLPSSSLLQMKVRSQEVRSRALAKLQSSHDPRLDFISLAIRGKKVNFDKVITMMDDMVAILKKEQITDDDKKEFCEGKIDQGEDKGKELALDLSDLTKTIEETGGQISKLTEEISALAAGIKALDKSVAEATANRQAENAEYKQTMAENTAAKELMKIALNRLNKFYNPKQYKAPPKQELSAQQRIAVNMGSEDAPTVAPSGIAGTGVTVFAQIRSHSGRDVDVAAPPPPPAAVPAYQTKGEESAGVVAMVNLLIADLDKEMTEMETEEKDSQGDYEKYIADSGDKRREDTKLLEAKTSMKAEAGALLTGSQGEKKDKTKEAYANSIVLRDLHAECDWLLSNFETRKTARSGEIDSIIKAKAVLSGADYSLAQIGASRSNLRGS